MKKSKTAEANDYLGISGDSHQLILNVGDVKKSLLNVLMRFEFIYMTRKWV
jgi:hypothetical protein